MHFLGSALPMDQPDDDSADPPECAPECPLCAPELYEPEALPFLQRQAALEREPQLRR